MLTKPLSCKRRYEMYCVDHFRVMPTRTQNASQLVLTKPIPCQRGHKMHLNMCRPCQPGNKMNLNMCWPNADMPARTQNISQLVLTKPTPCKGGHKMYLKRARKQSVSQPVLTKPFLFQRRHKIYLNLCWPNPSHTREDTKYISTCVYQNHPMSARTQNSSQLVLTKPLTCQQWVKMYNNLRWPNPSLAIENTKFISTWIA